MDAVADWLIAFVSDQDNPIGLAVLASSALIEYVFPPFPGDTITLFGAVLITAYGWSFVAVFGAVMTGSVGGSMLAYLLGHRWQTRRTRRSRGTAPAPNQRRTLDQLVAKFERHGAAYLVVNRFLPGVRALFFVAAGMARMRPRAVLFYSALSAALWNLGIIALGGVLGLNFETLKSWMTRYAIVSWTVVGAVVVFLIVRSIVRKRRTARTSRTDDRFDLTSGVHPNESDLDGGS